MKGGPGFRAGLSSLGFGFRFLLTSPRSLPYAIVPALVLMVLVTISVAISVSLIRPWAEGWIHGDGASTWVTWAGAAVGWLVAILAGLIGLLVSLALAAPLSAPALERLVAHAEEKLGVPSRAESGFFAEMWIGLKSQAFAFCIALPILLLLWIVDLLLPPAVVVTVPLKLLVAAFSLSWNLLDYPLTLRGMRMRDRMKLLGAHKRATMSFGVAFAILFWLPCFQVLMLPVGVLAATRLVWMLAQASPELATSIGLALPAEPEVPALAADGSGLASAQTASAQAGSSSVPS
ncbi:MAG: EI24 domain-containing protein [Polyangiaceae bacterium]